MRASVAELGKPGDVDEERVDLDPEADSADRLRCNQSCAAAEERLVDSLAGIAVVDDRTAHAFHRLLRAMYRVRVLASRPLAGSLRRANSCLLYLASGGRLVLLHSAHGGATMLLVNNP